MTAGRGIAHSERTAPEVRRAAHTLHGIQSWVALPRADEEHVPCFRHHPAGTLPRFERGGATLRLIAGKAFGHTSPVEVFSEMFYVDAEMPDTSRIALGDALGERAIYVAKGELENSGDAHPAGRMLLLSESGEVTLSARADTRAMLLGGAPLDGERHIWWNFVSSEQQRIERAKDDWRAERFDAVPGETERIPLPEA
jgi:redox-sensitive bicupin YhaK (pirin superfamily)